MNEADLEQVYEAVARKVDTVGAAQSELFLAKLVLLLTHRHGDVDEVLACIDDAAANLDG